MFFTYNLTATVFYTCGNLSYSTMLNLETGNRQELGILSTIRLILAVIAQFMVNALVLKLVRTLGSGDTYDQAGWTEAAVIMGILSAALTLVCYFTTAERPDLQATGAFNQEPDLQASLKSLSCNRYWLVLFFSFVFTYAMTALHIGSMTSMPSTVSEM